MTADNGRQSDDVSRRTFLLASGGGATTALAGCTGNTDDQGTSESNGGSGNDDSGNDDSQDESESQSLSGDITITGSSTVYPVSVAMAEEFQKKHSGVNISVDSTGTGGGFKNHFCPGNSDINGASRPIKDSEVEQCAGNDVTPKEFHIAGDALTVAVNKEADWVDSMTFDGLAQIWGPDGAQKWSDVRDDWPDEEFELYGPASTSGTFDWFTANVVGEDGAHREDYEATEEDNIIVQGIEGSKHAMGYFGYAYYKENKDRVKAVKIAEEDKSKASMPSLDNAKSGDYPMARPLFIYPAAESIKEKNQVYQFLKFYLEKAETDIVKQIGYVPTSTETRDENLSKLEDIRGN
jgi:phosphate transport system substrate-binding protein